jgi:predicted DNA-binding protein (MmcQ/YjbR family)
VAKRSLEQVLPKVRELCLALPEAVETLTWGAPHFRVKEKIFAGIEAEGGRPVIGFKLSLERQAQMLRDARFTKAPYVGHRGWVSMDLSDVRDWEEVRALLIESYVAIAPKKLAAQLAGAAQGSERAAIGGSKLPRAQKSPRAEEKKKSTGPATRGTRSARAPKAGLATPPDPRRRA